jgi:hypothetical protein
MNSKGQIHLQHVAVGAVSFSGSTILSYVLGSLPGCRSAGESHWLVDESSNGKLLGCCQCGQECRVLTPSFREELRHDQTGWYQRIGRQLGADILISSDKTPRLLDRFDPQREFDLIVVFKEPGVQFGSYKKAMDRRNTPYHAENYLKSWVEFYEGLSRYEVCGQRLFLDSASFQKAPADVISKLCGALELRIDESCLNYWAANHHTVGGNFNPYSRLKNEPTRMAVRAQSAYPLTEEEWHIIRQDARSSELFARMKTLAIG